MNPLTVVIPSRNLANLMACVSRIDRLDPRVEIIVVDDGLDFFDQRIEDLAIFHSCMGCSFYLGIKPFIYARNCNLGITMAGRNDVLLLNDDALLVTPGGFTALQIVASRNPGFGVISAATNNVGNVNQHPRDVGLRQDSMVCFVAALIPRTTIDRVGMLDERFGGADSSGAPIYGWEDNDYCRRVEEAGLRVGIYDYCFVDHSRLISTFRGAGPLSIEPGRKVFLDKWGS